MQHNPNHHRCKSRRENDHDYPPGAARSGPLRKSNFLSVQLFCGIAEITAPDGKNMNRQFLGDVEAVKTTTADTTEKAKP